MTRPAVLLAAVEAALPDVAALNDRLGVTLHPDAVPAGVADVVVLHCPARVERTGAVRVEGVLAREPQVQILDGEPVRAGRHGVDALVPTGDVKAPVVWV